VDRDLDLFKRRDWPHFSLISQKEVNIWVICKKKKIKKIINYSTTDLNSVNFVQMKPQVSNIVLPLVY